MSVAPRKSAQIDTVRAHEGPRARPEDDEKGEDLASARAWPDAYGFKPGHDTVGGGRRVKRFVGRYDSETMESA